MRIKDVIAHTFDYHVTGKMDWSLEQLVEWVKMVEPDDATIGVQPSEAIFQWQRLGEQQIQPSRRQEAQEWQAVRQAFAARYDTRRRRRA